MKLRDHERAKMAYEHVHSYVRKGDKASQKYGTMCLKLPVIVHTAGLAPALHFVAARTDENQRTILDHLGEQVGVKARAGLLKKAREANLDETRALTREVQRCLQWYKRFVQSELRVDLTADDDRGEDD